VSHSKTTYTRNAYGPECKEFFKEHGSERPAELRRPAQGRKRKLGDKWVSGDPETTES
jgi:hypothetical protein